MASKEDILDKIDELINEGKAQPSDYLNYIIVRKRTFIGKQNKEPQLVVLTAAEQAINGASLSEDDAFKKQAPQRVKALVAITK